MTADDAALTRFANSEIHQNVAETNAQLNLRFVEGKRIGVASTGRLDDGGPARVAEAAGRIARNSRRTTTFVSLPGPGRPDPRRCRPRTRRRPPRRHPSCAPSGARAVIAAADEAGVTAYGSFATSDEAIAVANSLGHPRRRGAHDGRS